MPDQLGPLADVWVRKSKMLGQKPKSLDDRGMHVRPNDVVQRIPGKVAASSPQSLCYDLNAADQPQVPDGIDNSLLNCSNRHTFDVHRPHRPLPIARVHKPHAKPGGAGRPPSGPRPDIHGARRLIDQAVNVQSGLKRDVFPGRQNGAHGDHFRRRVRVSETRERRLAGVQAVTQPDDPPVPLQALEHGIQSRPRPGVQRAHVRRRKHVQVPLRQCRQQSPTLWSQSHRLCHTLDAPR